MSVEKPEWARPDCPHCRGWGYYRVIASDTDSLDDKISCGNCLEAFHALSHPTASANLERLADDLLELSPEELASDFGLKRIREAAAALSAMEEALRPIVEAVNLIDEMDAEGACSTPDFMAIGDVLETADQPTVADLRRARALLGEPNP